MSAAHKKQKITHSVVGQSSTKVTEKIVFNMEEKMVSVPTCFYSGMETARAHIYTFQFENAL